MFILPVILTYTNNPDKAQDLLQSAKAYGWNIQILVEEGPYRGANHKFNQILSQIESLKAMGVTHIISVDAFDTVVTNTPQHFLGQMHSLGFPAVVLAAETNCYPDKSIEHKFPTTGTRWKYVNSPFILDLRQEIIEDFRNIEDRDDQVHLSEYYLADPARAGSVLDFNCRLFQTLYGVPQSVFAEDLRNKETDTYPCFFHGNGGADMSWIPKADTSKAKVLIGVASAGYLKDASFMQHLNNLQKPSQSQVQFSFGQSPAQARNHHITAALKSGFSHVLFIDDDVFLPPDALIKLLKHDKDIVSGLYVGRCYPHQPMIFDDSDVDRRYKWHMLNDGDEGLKQIQNLGFGCVLIKTEVFKKIEEPWVTLGQLGDKTGWSDDIEFFMKAHKAGIEMFCDLSIKCGHSTTCVMYPYYEDGKWTVRYDTKGTNTASIKMLTPDEYIEQVEIHQAMLAKLAEAENGIR